MYMLVHPASRASFDFPEAVQFSLLAKKKGLCSQGDVGGVGVFSKLTTNSGFASEVIVLV